MKERQTVTKKRQKLTKGEWALLGLTALFLVFLFRNRNAGIRSLSSGAPEAEDETTAAVPPEAADVPGTTAESPAGHPAPDTAEDTSENKPAAGPVPPDAPAPIDINRADAEELADLPGIGPALAARVVEYRTQHGPFASKEALMEVSGIGPAKYAACEAYFTAEPVPGVPGEAADRPPDGRNLPLEALEGGAAS